MSVEIPAAEPLRTAVVGLGYWGPNLLRVLFELPNVEVAWICDLDDARVDRLLRRYPSVRGTSRVDDVLDDPEVDAVLVATPVYTHFDIARRSLEAGKHTFVEKPLAPSPDEADELIQLADVEGLLLMCGHTFLYSPSVRRVKELLERAELGEVYFASSSRVNLGLHQRDTSVVWDLGPHDFSILLHWFDELPESVRAVGRDSIVKGISDVAFVTLSFPSGLIANVELSWLAPSKLRRTVLVGSEKMVVYDDGGPEPVKVFDHGVVYRDPETFGEYHLSYRTGDVLVPKLDGAEPLQLELRDFTTSIQAGTAPLAGTTLARDVVRLTAAADESLANGGTEIAVDRPRRFVAS
jgi:predicted dehydrogenase